MVRFTITGSFRVEQGDRDAVESDSNDYLDVDFSQIDGAIDSTTNVDVRIDSVEAVYEDD